MQGRGQLRRELNRALRTGRAMRRPRRQAATRTARFANMVMITERPAEVTDGAVPGHWEGDCIMGAGNASAIGILVERSTRLTMLPHLSHRHSAEHLRDALLATLPSLPTHLRR